MLKIQTPDGIITWTRRKCQARGSEAALAKLAAARGGRFGLFPDRVPAEEAHQRADSFLHLVRTIWPDHRVLVDTEPDDRAEGCIY